ncbi:3-deoxy-7-phosphoheptulonate synthase [Streptomyces samsunensis]|uniref:3-deoxy-7-phosphoheptulonate synthase n=1 Tax=Streptomyces malaysiensis TaxID=92644 RepID=UPI0015826A40|nr:3-deoxy-7-phosphoheptulonate synthase [Streptomyces samsunensis]NUH42930.1 3-deoxy-7-phosphoheptulonate synthase [Streptomyces samsunensis]
MSWSTCHGSHSADSSSRHTSTEHEIRWHDALIRGSARRGQDVTECLGGGCGLGEDDLSARFRTACDPRLNEEQAIELAYTVADLLAAAVRPVTDTGSRNPSNHETPPGTG